MTVTTESTSLVGGSNKTPKYDYQRFSQLTGPFQPVPEGPYKVEFQRLLKREPFSYRMWTRFLCHGGLLVVIGMMIYIFLPTHWIGNTETISYVSYLNWIMLGSLAVLEGCRFIGTFSSAWSTLRACDPIPVMPPTGMRIAFCTTRVSSEPISMALTTLRDMLRHTYDGIVDVWVLDETDDPVLKKACKKLGVRHFTRKGVARWNQDGGVLAHRTKHGNFNAWMQDCAEKGIEYDALAGVDTDQRPLPDFLNRLVCYLRDPNVAFAVGPQVYGNYDAGVVPRWAESQASFFQAVIQRAGNRVGTPMFVGTNYAIRWEVLKQIGGFQPCITEDMATGLAAHAARNPVTKKKWRSVYTPDVLAFGEGPQSWGDLFNQQQRWAAGAGDTWKRMVWRVVFKLRPTSLFHYLLLLMYYPSAALSWILGALSGFLYLVFGASAVQVSMSHWFTLYGSTAILQMSLYFWNRRHNVSPHEPEGSYGLSGMVLSALTGPIYAAAWVSSILGLGMKTFKDTPKGENASTDGLRTFRTHLLWGALLAGSITYGVYAEHTFPAMLTWASLGVLISVLPLSLSLLSRWKYRHLSQTEATAMPTETLATQQIADAKTERSNGHE